MGMVAVACTHLSVAYDDQRYCAHVLPGRAGRQGADSLDTSAMQRPDAQAAASSPQEGIYWQSACSQPGGSSGQVWPKGKRAVVRQVHRAPDMLRSGLPAHLVLGHEPTCRHTRSMCCEICRHLTQLRWPQQDYLMTWQDTAGR